MSEILSTEQAALHLCLAVSTLEKMRVRGDGPVFVKLGPRRVAYARADLDAWLASRPRFTSTSECTEAA
jgi:predicted DNA-binding transcriptional regulator AlpA